MVESDIQLYNQATSSLDSKFRNPQSDIRNPSSLLLNPQHRKNFPHLEQVFILLIRHQP